MATNQPPADSEMMDQAAMDWAVTNEHFIWQDPSMPPDLESAAWRVSDFKAWVEHSDMSAYPASGDQLYGKSHGSVDQNLMPFGDMKTYGIYINYPTTEVPTISASGSSEQAPSCTNTVTINNDANADSNWNVEVYGVQYSGACGNATGYALLTTESCAGGNQQQTWVHTGLTEGDTWCYYVKYEKNGNYGPNSAYASATPYCGGGPPPQ